MRRMRIVQLCLALAVLAGLGGFGGSGALARPVGQAQPGCVRFNETNHTVCDRFLAYWNANGGLAQQGYPISDVLQERSDTDGKVYTTQYFERAVFEMHPENQQPYDVLLSLLGVFEYKYRYGSAGAPNQTVSTAPGAVRFNETGHTVGGKFLAYWQQHGGLPQQGYPISDEFQEKSSLDGKTYTVQYFQRAVFELHPENQAPYDVLLSQLGKFYYDRKHSVSPPAATATPRPAATSTPVPLPPANAGIGETVRRNGMAFTVPSVDITTKGVAVHFVLTDESAGAVSFVLANADQHLVGVRKEYDKTEPDRREQVNLNNGQSYTGATGFRADFKTGPEKAVTYIIDNLPGIGSVHVDVPIDLP